MAKNYTESSKELVLKNETAQIVLRTYSNPKKFYLYKEASEAEKLLLEGFERDIEFCPEVTVLLENGEQAVCLVGDVGAHSQNLALIRFDQAKPIQLKFNEGENLVTTITSDKPQFSFRDDNQDRYQDIVAWQRDYEKDPLVDQLEKVYLNAEAGFKLK